MDSEKSVTLHPEVVKLLQEIAELEERVEAGNRETERVVQEYVREEKQKPQTLGRAFKLLLFEEAVHEKLGLPAEKVLWYRDHYRTGGYVAPEEMEAMLREAGWEKGDDETWQGA